MSLGAKDCQLLLKVIGNLHAAQSSCDIVQATKEGLAAVVPGDCYDVVLFGTARPEESVFFSNPGTYSEGEMRYMLENITQHPLGKAFLEGDPGSICISQFVAPRKWQSSQFYTESGYQRLGLKHELAALVPDVTQAKLAAVSVLRSRDFSERDRKILDQLRSHLGRVWKRTLLAKPVVTPLLVRQIFPDLSLREAEVLFWITEGKLNREIADILQRSLTTVQEHVENLLRKLNSENRHAMTTFALRKLLED